MPRYSGPIRRSQLVGYGGVGSLTTSTNGTTIIAAGIDHWFPNSFQRRSPIDLNEYVINEWRLEREMGVDHFRLPPDFREQRYGEDATNTRLTIPYLRFPRWHVCKRCHRMELVPSTERGVAHCRHCTEKRGPALAQVSFIAMCDYGHVQEFPWSEWVHRSLTPSCRGTLKLIATGSASLQAIKISCTSCGAERSLARITFATPSDTGDSTHLSNELSNEGPYLCSGFHPWHDEHDGRGCGRQLRGALLSAANVYFALTRSAIYLPRSTESVPSELIVFLEQPQPSALITALKAAGHTLVVQQLKIQYPNDLLHYSDAQIAEALALLDRDQQIESSTDPQDPDRDLSEARLRSEEYTIIRQELADPELLIRRVANNQYADDVIQHFARIMLVDKLRETRVQYGFNRVFAESSYTDEDRQAMLWKHQPSQHQSWLPAYTVYGEGLYFELDEDCLRAWERREEIVQRIGRLAARYKQVQDQRGLPSRDISPRLVLLHTLAHLLINQLAFECGYSAASLKERLYASASSETSEPMAGVLIYTASGDAEGTLGGLVRMGKPEHLEPVIRRMLRAARWCSADPICMEIGDSAGQGPDSCNLAACHSCALTSETSCELNNRFLDRAVLIGTLGSPEIGYFHSLAT